MNRRLLIRRVITGAFVIAFLAGALVRSYLLHRFDGLSLLVVLAALILIVAAVCGAFDRRAER